MCPLRVPRTSAQNILPAHPAATYNGEYARVIPRQDPITQRKEKCPPPRGARCAQASIVYGIGGRLEN